MKSLKFIHEPVGAYEPPVRNPCCSLLLSFLYPNPILCRPFSWSPRQNCSLSMLTWPIALAAQPSTMGYMTKVSRVCLTQLLPWVLVLAFPFTCFVTWWTDEGDTPGLSFLAGEVITGSGPQGCCENSVRACMSGPYAEMGTEGECRDWAFCSLCRWCLAQESARSRYSINIG